MEVTHVKRNFSIGSLLSSTRSFPCVFNIKLQTVWIFSQFVVTVLVLNTKPYVLRSDEQNSHPSVHKLLFNLL